MINDNFLKSLSTNLQYNPTQEQALLMAKLVRFAFAVPGRELFLLRGYAGTGKSSLVGALVKTLSQYGMRCILLSPTGRAAKVFGAYAGESAYTIHRKIYRQKRFSADMSGFSLTENRYKNTLFIVDEASMIADAANDSVVCGSGSLLDDLIEFVYSAQGCKLIMIGDSAQLPPVGRQESPALDRAKLERYDLSVTEYELKEVVRQEMDSGILFNATALRGKMDEATLPMPEIRIKGFNDITRVGGDELIDALETAYSRDGTEQTIIVTRSNKRANIFNEGIRNRLLCREEELSSGDLLLIAKNNYFWGEEIEDIDFIANGDVASVVRVRGYDQMYGFRFADVTLHFPDYKADLDAKIILDTLHTESPSLTPEMNNMLFTRVMDDYSDVRLKRDKFKRVKSDVWFNALQVKYAYAVTCHKAQGGQWKNVFLDMGNMNIETVNAEFYRWLYTAFTRATNNLYLINVSDSFIGADSDAV
ncbi:MAG: AAA family ATPase [Bacteroidales bacterium]